MSIPPLKRNNSNSKNNSNLIIVSKGRLESAKGNINYITLQEGDHKLTMQISNNSLNKKDINKAVKNIRSQNLHNSKSNTNLFKNDNDETITMNSKEKKYFKILYKQKEKNKYKIKETKNDNFIETTGFFKDNNDIIQDDAFKKNEININKLNNSNKEEKKCLDNKDNNDNDNIDDNDNDNDNDNIDDIPYIKYYKYLI